MADKSTLTRPWSSISKLNDTLRGTMTIPRSTVKRPFPGNLHPFPKILGIILPPISLRNYPVWCEELTHLKRPWWWEKYKAGGERDGRGWDGWMASLTRWTRVWVNSRSWWWTGKPGMLQSMGLQRVGHNWVTELNWTASQVSSEELGVWVDVRKCKRQPSATSATP